MAEVIALPCADDTTLVLQQTAGIEWYACILRTPQHDIILGAESRTYLLSRLRHVMSPDGQDTGELAGMPVRWILSLSEQHATLYVHDQSSRAKILCWQSADGTALPPVTVDAVALDAWERILGAATRREA